jgi:hypothetical protein
LTLTSTLILTRRARPQLAAAPAQAHLPWRPGWARGVTASERAAGAVHARCMRGACAGQVHVRTRTRVAYG